MLKQRVIDTLEKLIDIGIALSSEPNTDQLLEMILSGAKSITNADFGILFLVQTNKLQIELVQCTTLNISFRLAFEYASLMPDIPLYQANGEPNLANASSYTFHNNQAINIADAYLDERFDFSETKKIEQQYGYHLQSFLSMPLKNHENDTIGVLMLVNAMQANTQEIIAFDEVAQRFVEALASQAAIVLTKRHLIQDLESMFESFIKLLAIAIDDKSPYTGGHCRRVPELTMMLADAAHAKQEGYLKDFKMTEHDRYALKIAGWLHDCGKITTPEYVIDKATKLQTIFDRIELIETRFEVLKRDAEIALLKQKGAKLDTDAALEQAYAQRIHQLNDDLAFLKHANTGAEFMSAADQQRVFDIAANTWQLDDAQLPLLSENEVQNLTISHGTLTESERLIINHHIQVTIEMLGKINFPKHLREVPKYAGGHHERMDGTGYPNRLTREQMSIQARCMAIADIFEALTAKDRPYKEGKKLSVALNILQSMKDDGHIDPDLFEVFMENKVYLRYAQKFLDDVLIDVD